MSDIKQPESSIFSKVSMDFCLMDVRRDHWGIRFGTVKDVCKQYGIKCVQHPKCMEFIAPKTRLLLFKEKLHFSKTPYSSKKLL